MLETSRSQSGLSPQDTRAEQSTFPGDCFFRRATALPPAGATLQGSPGSGGPPAGGPRRGSPAGDPSASVSPGCTRQQHRGIEGAPHRDSGASLPAFSVLALGSASSVTFGEFS